MKVGDPLRIIPTFDTTYGIPDDNVPLPAVVVYIHPQQRYYRVRYTAANGESWTETFPCTPCELDRRKDKREHENDCNHEQQGRRGKVRDHHQSRRHPRP